jgi:hypothetical protein
VIITITCPCVKFEIKSAESIYVLRFCVHQDVVTSGTYAPFARPAPLCESNADGKLARGYPRARSVIYDYLMDRE